MATLIVTASLAEGQDEARGRYLQAVTPLLIAAGGQPVKRLRVTNVVAGNADSALALVMDFPDADTVTAAFASDEYQALLPDRDAGFSTIEILVTEDFG